MMMDPLQAALFNAHRDQIWMAYSALPDAPVIAPVAARRSGWRPAVAHLLRRVASRVDRPSLAGPHPC